MKTETDTIMNIMGINVPDDELFDATPNRLLPDTFFDAEDGPLFHAPDIWLEEGSVPVVDEATLNTLIDDVLMRDDIATLRAVRAAGVDLTTWTNGRLTALELATQNDSLLAITYLLSLGAPVTEYALVLAACMPETRAALLKTQATKH